jgi:formylmethanofuran dehydrogenase subunit B
VLRAKLKGIELDSEIVAQATGLNTAQLDSLFSELASAKYGSIFYEQTYDDSVFDLATDSLLTLIRQLNDLTRFVGMKLRKDGNSHSAVLAWSSGYPFAINFARKFPRFNWLEYSAETVLTRGECDAILFATGTDLQVGFSGLSRTAQDHLGSIPKIAMSPIQNFPSDVSFQVGVPGLTEAGEFCRNDDVSMPLASARETASHNTESILEKILTGIG